MSQIQIKNLSFSYPTSPKLIFDNISFNIDSDWKIGLIGNNGRGKTTLLKLLANEYEYSGKIDCNVNFIYFPKIVKNSEQLVLDLFLEDYFEEDIYKFQKELELLNLDKNIIYDTYFNMSGGEKTKILLALLFIDKNNFPLIDEPTNHLDLAGRIQVAKYLKSKEGFILISHDEEFLNNSIDYVLSINKSTMQLEKGNYSAYQYNQEVREKFELNENEKLNRSINHLSRQAQKTKEWSNATEKSKYAKFNKEGKPADRGFIGRKSAKMMKRSIAAQQKKEEAILKKSKLLKDIEKTEELKISGLKYHSNKYITISDLKITYDNKTVIENFHLNINSEDLIILSGINGSGKSSIIKAIREEIAYEGKIEKANGLIISYVSQNISNLNGKIESYLLDKEIDKTLFLTLLRKMGFERELFNQDIKGYSDGQKKKVLLATSLASQAHLYIWDEPLNYLDINSRKQIEKVILDNKMTLLVVEHDQRFVKKIANKVVEI